jgi:CBS domain containing-hemolysin-like protein
LFIKEDIKLDNLYNLFINKRIHIAIVYDEFGIFKGVVTLEDIIEEILKTEIVDEVDKVEDMRALAIELFKKKLVD